MTRLQLPIALLLLLLLPLTACAAPDAAESGASLSFRMVFEPGDPGIENAETVAFGDEQLQLGAVRRFALGRARAVEDGMAGEGRYAIFFELDGDSVQQAFQQWTGALARHRMAWIHKGEVLAAPIILTALNGWGVLSCGSKGLSEAEAERIAAELRSGA